MTATPTWTYTPQEDFLRATVLDETGEVIAVVKNLDNDEANQIAALIAAAPRLLQVCELAVNVSADTPRPEELAELWHAAWAACKLATKADV
jgi:hypothetical protein